MHYFQYGDDAVQHLKRRDRRLGEAIDIIGHVLREIRPGLFAALVHSIVGQQISTRAGDTIWRRIEDDMGTVTPEAVAACSIEKLQAFGISFRKAQYIRGAAESVLDGRLDISALHSMSDDKVCEELVKLSGVGVWTAQMLMLFSMQRPDILSYGDLAILRGMRMLYRHREITRPLFEKYRRRYSPYGSVASLYLWAIAGGAIEGLTDPAPKRKVT
jgi:DNA-3-methyladenine glycosylase II